MSHLWLFKKLKNKITHMALFCSWELSHLEGGPHDALLQSLKRFPVLKVRLEDWGARGTQSG